MLPETPQNGEYLVAAYAATVAILVGYFVALLGRTRRFGISDTPHPEHRERPTKRGPGSPS